MNYYFDSLLVPEASLALVEDILPCFFGQRDRAQVFVSTLHRLVWEYNFVNQTFVSQYRILHAKDYLQGKSHPMNDVLIFGGSYSLSRGQIRSIIDLIDKNKEHIRGL